MSVLSSPIGILDTTITDASTNSTTVGATIRHHSTVAGGPTIGFGIILKFLLHSDANLERSAGEFNITWQSAVDGATAGRMQLSVFDAGVSREWIRGFALAGSVTTEMRGNPPANTALSRLGLVNEISGGSVSGTVLGMNAASAFTGNLVDLQFNGTSRLQVDYRGHHLIAAGAVASYSSDFISEWRDGPAGNTRAMVNFDAGTTAFTQQVGNITNRTRMLTDASSFYFSTGNDLQFQCGTFSGGGFISFVTGLGMPGPNLQLTTAAFLVDAVTRTRALDAVTATTSIVQYFDHNSSGTPANGFGGEIQLRLKSSNTDARQAGSLFWSWVDAADATRKARLAFNVYDTAIRTALQIDTDGAQPFTSIVGSANSLRLAGGAAANPVTLTAIGSDTDIALKLAGKGVGPIQLGPTAQETVYAGPAAITAVDLLLSGLVPGNTGLSYGLNLTATATGANSAYAVAASFALEGPSSGTSHSTEALHLRAGMGGTAQGNVLGQRITASMGGTAQGVLTGQRVDVSTSGTSAATTLYGHDISVFCNTGTSTADLIGTHIKLLAGGAVTFARGILIDTPLAFGGGSIGTAYGLKIENINTAGTNYSIHTGQGFIHLGDVLAGEATAGAPKIGFLGAGAVVRQVVTGSRGGNAALASALTALASLGLITDSSSV